MPYYVVKLNRSGRRVISEHLHEDDAFRRVRRVRGGVVVNTLGQVVRDSGRKRVDKPAPPA